MTAAILSVSSDDEDTEPETARMHSVVLLICMLLIIKVNTYDTYFVPGTVLSPFGEHLT